MKLLTKLVKLNQVSIQIELIKSQIELNNQWDKKYIVRSNEILGWGGVGNRQLLCFFTA
jgi:hypothetical protein